LPSAEQRAGRTPFADQVAAVGLAGVEITGGIKYAASWVGIERPTPRMGFDVAEVIEARHHSAAEIGSEEVASGWLDAHSVLLGTATCSIQRIQQCAVWAVVPNAPVAHGGKDIAALERHAISGARRRGADGGFRWGGGVRQPNQGGQSE